MLFKGCLRPIIQSKEAVCVGCVLPQRRRRRCGVGLATPLGIFPDCALLETAMSVLGNASRPRLPSSLRSELSRHP